jgi:glycogen synthase
VKKSEIIFFCGGEADIVGAHESWRSGVQHSSEVSITFSSQMEEACKDLNVSIYMIAPGPAEVIHEDGLFTLERRAKRSGRGIFFHLFDALYAISLIGTAIKCRAKLAFVDTGAASLYWFSILKLFGVKVVPVLHNTLWPTGFLPARKGEKAVAFLDKILFWRWAPSNFISVSPECERQALSQTGIVKYEPIQIRAQFHKKYFKAISDINFPDQEQQFHVMFIGRVARMKGVFDILKMAAYVDERLPGRVRWRICGRGPDLNELRAMHKQMRLEGVVDILGWVSLDDLQVLYAETHACIVPTTSEFAEGLAMTAAEAVLAMRPVVVSSVVPAGEILGAACLIGDANNFISHAEKILRMASEEELYLRMKRACELVEDQFYDRSLGLTEAVKRILKAT